MEDAMAMEADSWLKKADDLEHQYSLPPDQLAQSVDDLGLLQAAEEPPDADTDTTAASSPFKVTMYQCAQCKDTFTTLDLCVKHPCRMIVESAADSTQPSQQRAQPQSQSALAQNEQLLNIDKEGLNYRWGQHDTEALLGILTDSVDKFSNPNMKRKFIWKDSCRRMLEKGFNISQLQCENRWKTLKAMWRKSQTSSSSPPFFREMCDIAERYPQLMLDVGSGAGDASRAASSAPGKSLWSHDASLTMLELLKTRHAEYSDPSIKRRALWTEIADTLRDMGLEYTPEQCEGRFKTLLQAYKRTQARCEQAGGGGPESDCAQQVEELVRLIPELASVAAARPEDRRPTSGPRRRRSGRAARQRDLLSWLDGWLQEQRRWDEAVQATLRAQHMERLRVLTEIRDELRTGGSRVPQTRPPQLPQPPDTRQTAAGDTVVAQVFLA